MKSKLLFFLGLLPLFSPAQPAIGTQLPDSITSAIPAQKNQLIILDFFATWCTSCAKAFPKLDSLQTQFGNRISIRLVSSYGTRDTKEKITAFFIRRKQATGMSFSFPIIYNDSLLKNSFPHNKIPHYVWIYNNKLIAITRSNDVTASNIKKILKGKKLTLPTKIDSATKLSSPPKGRAGGGNLPLKHDPPSKLSMPVPKPAFSPLTGGDTEGVLSPNHALPNKGTGVAQEGVLTIHH
ncbi:thioredoxin domain-containing protein [Lacibacter sp. H375]|uniref:TlpA family protein disulfide reductase n=1 Tax=Lacibacter sp. H375 TaxID=3133424 RepID=UPI0030BFE537